MKVSKSTIGAPGALHGLAGVILLALTGSVSVAHGVTLVENGQPRAAIVLSEASEARERVAANELVEHLQTMTGAELPIVTGDAPDGLLPIYIGESADGRLDALSRAERDNPSSFTLRVRCNRIDIRGLTEEGTLFGTYELLEQLGFRWYLPGDYGRVVPEGKTARIDEQTTAQGPTMVYRNLQHLHDDVPWARRARLGGKRRATGRHGIPGLPRSNFAENPELYSLIDGERRDRQDCLSNPETLRRAVAAFRTIAREQGEGPYYIGAASHDGGGYCQCGNCKTLDRGVYDPTGDRESMTDRYIWFFNQILDGLEDEFPEMYIVHYTYAAHMMPPAIAMNERIVPVFAPITLDRIRGMDNPMSPDRHLLRWLIDEYAQRGVREMVYRGYYHNLACPQFPLSQLDRIENETRAFAQKGIKVMRVENVHTSWSSAFLDLYVATRMMWNTDTDVPALLEEFYALYYGPAAAPMRAYHEGVESAFRDTPYFAGSSYPYLPIFLHHPRRDQLRSHLAEAASAADGVYGKRIAAVRLNWDRMEAFLDMIDARNNHDFPTARARMQDFYRLSDQGALMEPLEDGPGRGYALPRLVYHRERADNGGSYFNRFFRPTTEEGYRRAVEIGEIVAALPDEWQFLIDPAEIGEICGYQRPGELGGNWQPMKTSSRSWSDQGLHYYKGMAWYRTSVQIPEKYEDRPLYLWFGGVDRVAHVWINGVPMGTSREPREGLPGVPGSFRPFDMPTGNAIKFGEENWVVVKIENDSLSELGTGGILGPVMFWSPNDPDWDPSN